MEISAGVKLVALGMSMLCCVAATAPLAAEEGKTLRIRKGNAAIVIPDPPINALDGYRYQKNLTQRHAAETLQMLVEKATGFQIPVVRADAHDDKEIRVFVGYGPHLKDWIDPPEEPEGIKIFTDQSDVFLIGEIAPAGTNNWPVEVDRGVMHAVETFAERVMGYRFVFSTPEDPDMFELGTVIPDRGVIEVDLELHITDAPAFALRDPHGLPRGHIGLRTGGSRAFFCNHSYPLHQWRRHYAEEHPELFRMKEDGTRDFNHLDYAEPTVLDKRLEHLEEYIETGSSYGIGGRRPTSLYIPEEPTDNHPASYSEAAQELIDPDAGWGRQSRLWFNYVRRLADEAAKRWPQMRISTLAYQWHYYPPDFDMPDNVDVMLCLMRSSTQNKQPEVFQHNLDTVKEWLTRLDNDPDRLFLWEYWCWPGIHITPPTIAPHAMQKWLQTVEPHVSGVFINGGGHPLQFQYLMYRLWLRMLWDPNLDVNAEIKDVCHNFYGPAGEAMNAFYRHLIDRYEQEWDNAQLIYGMYYATPELYYGRSYQADHIRRLASLLEEARKEAGLPARIETEARHGTAVYLLNPLDEDSPVTMRIQAMDSEVVQPAAAWETGSFAYSGRIEQGQQLEITAGGEAYLVDSSGERRTVTSEMQGAAPVLAPELPQVVNFFVGNKEDTKSFHVEILYAGERVKDGDPEVAEDSIFARRIEWVREPYLVFHPDSSPNTGFFAEAHMAHKHLEEVPSYSAPEVEALPQSIQDPGWQQTPETFLVRGSEEDNRPFNNFGFPADRTTSLRFAYTREALAVLVEAEGAPEEEETVSLRLHGETVEFSVEEGQEQESTILKQLEIRDDGWTALLNVDWETLGLSEEEGPVSRGNGRPRMLHKMNAQIQRSRGDDSYIWSPPLGSPWGHDQQGPGQLVFISM